MFVRSFVRRFATILKMTFVKSLVTVSKFHPQKWRLRLQDKKKVTNIGESRGILFCLISLCNETFNRVFISSQGFRNEIFLRLTIQIFLRYYFNFNYFFTFSSSLPHSRSTILILDTFEIISSNTTQNHKKKKRFLTKIFTQQYRNRNKINKRMVKNEMGGGNASS